MRLFEWAAIRRRIESALSLSFVCGHTYWDARLGPESVIVDLGANRGEFSIHAALRYGSRCFAVEPDPRVRMEFEKRANEKIKIYSFLIGNKDIESVPFYLYEDTVLNSLFNAHSSPQRVIHVPSKRFDTFVAETGLGEIDLLKVDIEGAETLLFDTLSDSNLLSIRQITIEFHDFVPALKMSDSVKRIIRRLRRTGFSCYRFSWPHHSDVIFLNKRGVRLPFLTKAYLSIFPIFLMVRNGWVRGQWA